MKSRQPSGSLGVHMTPERPLDGGGGPAGAKKVDYWWTVVAVDPAAVPLTAFLARKRWLTPDQVTWLSLVVAAPMGVLYALGRVGLIVGAVLFYLSFLLDCVDGKLARASGTSSPKGVVLDAVADGGRRAGGAAGLAVYLWRFEVGFEGSFWLAVAYGLLAFYFAQISGNLRDTDADPPRGRWARALALRRMTATPGTPDAAAIVFFFGPMTGLVIPALVIGCGMFFVAISLTTIKLIRR
jgi:phosphatidylglycerophosphate synthase